MPELPEVETVVRDLRPRVVGRTIQRVELGDKKLRRPWQPAWSSTVAGAKVKAMHRRGKWIIIDLDRDPRLIVHLGMTGQFTTAELTESRPDHLHFVFHLGELELRFRDIRRFGSIELFADDVTAHTYLDERLGPEPFDIDPAYFREALQKSGRTLKAALLDQTLIAGIGNIYADEALHRAGLHPEARGRSLKPAATERLRLAIQAVITQAVAGRGSTIRDYVGGSGLKGEFQNEFRAYGRDGEPCLTCGTLLLRFVVAGRSSHFCPKCQPE
jgi:formamidopyrimidine-DNA glycosylase